jgi:hypothetical protein
VNTQIDGTATCTAIQCTLRAALTEASASADATDTVSVPAGTYVLSSGLGALTTAATGVTIAGAGANSTFIDGGNAIRVLNVGSNASLSVAGVTLRNGNAGTGAGGDVIVQSQGALTLSQVRITGGTAARGGGLDTQGATALTISQSLIDANTASGTNASSDYGGGIFVEGQTFQTTVKLSDSTITGNTARQGGGIGVISNTAPFSLTGVTIARNVATATTGGGLVFASAVSQSRAEGTILAGNLGNVGQLAPAQGPSNCGTNRPAINGGGNVETGTDCGTAAWHQNTDPVLATSLDGSQPPALAIPANSPAVNIWPCTPGTDQRGVARPQGASCDAGAYEYMAPPVPPVPTPTPTPTPAPSATPTPTPTPTFDKTVVVKAVDGKVTVRRPGGTKFTPLDTTLGIALGSTVDTTDGEVLLTSIAKKGGKPQTAKFFDGVFKVTQSKSTTELTLNEPLASCKPTGKASAAAAKKKPKTRKLWGDGSGAFSTSGQYSAATVRGTRWLVQDTCAGTLTKVSRGVVSVRDNVKRKTIILKAGKSYLARPKKK